MRINRVKGVEKSPLGTTLRGSKEEHSKVSPAVVLLAEVCTVHACVATSRRQLREHRRTSIL